MSFEQRVGERRGCGRGGDRIVSCRSVACSPATLGCRQVGQLLLVLAAACGGCGRQGPELAPVSGRVTLDGKPLADADVEFQPAEGSPSYGTTDADGRFTLKYTRDLEGAELGMHTVRIKSQQEMVGPDGETIEQPQRVPQRYHAKSELRREVVRDENHFDDLHLESR